MTKEEMRFVCNTEEAAGRKPLECQGVVGGGTAPIATEGLLGQQTVD